MLQKGFTKGLEYAEVQTNKVISDFMIHAPSSDRQPLERTFKGGKPLH